MACRRCSYTRRSIKLQPCEGLPGGESARGELGRLSLIPAGALLDGVEGIQDKRPGMGHDCFWQIEAGYCVYVSPSEGLSSSAGCWASAMVHVDTCPIAAPVFADPQTLISAEDAASNERCAAVHAWHFADGATDKAAAFAHGANE